MSSSVPPDSAAPTDPTTPLDPSAPVDAASIDAAVRPARRLMFPTFDPDAGPRPAGMRHCPAREDTGQPALYQCSCYRTVPADEMMDFRELAPAVLTALGLPAYCCRDCFHTLEATGKVLHAAIAVTLGLDATTIASLEAASRFALGKGWHAVTARNAHLSRPANELTVPIGSVAP